MIFFAVVLFVKYTSVITLKRGLFISVVDS
jgi:hypothetical protein